MSPQMFKKTMLFEKPLFVAHAAMMPFDENTSTVRPDDTCSRKGARAHRQNLDGLIEIGEFSKKRTDFIKTERPPIRLDQCSVHSVRLRCCAHLKSPTLPMCSNLEHIVCRKPYRCWRAQPEKRIAKARAGIRPVALIGDVISKKTKRKASLFAARSIARTEVEDVVAGNADRVIARRLFATGVTPARHQVDPTRMRQRQIGKDRCVQMRHIDHLLVVEGWCAGVL